MGGSYKKLEGVIGQ